MKSPHELWEQSGHDGGRYRALMREHGLIRDLAPGEKPEPLPCGWPAKRAEGTLLLRLLNRTLVLMKEHPGMRDGQIAFNALHDLAPEIADGIRGTQVDPFHDDAKLDAFFDAVAQADRS